MTVVGKRLTAASVTVATFFFASSALAHSRPKVMVPAPDTTVQSPRVVSVTFTEAPEPKFSSLTLTDEEGKQWNTAPSVSSTDDPKTLKLSLPVLKPGGYLVHWVTVAADGHRMEGEYKFSVKR